MFPVFGCLNCPRFPLAQGIRGASPIAGAILAGEEETRRDHHADRCHQWGYSGPILSQKKVPIEPQDTTESLETKLAANGADLLMETLPVWFEGRLTPQPQNHAAAHLYQAYCEIRWGDQLESDGHRDQPQGSGFSALAGVLHSLAGEDPQGDRGTCVASADAVEPGLIVPLSDPDSAGRAWARAKAFLH